MQKTSLSSLSAQAVFRMSGSDRASCAEHPYKLRAALHRAIDRFRLDPSFQANRRPWLGDLHLDWRALPQGVQSQDSRLLLIISLSEISRRPSSFLIQILNTSNLVPNPRPRNLEPGRKIKRCDPPGRPYRKLARPPRNLESERRSEAQMSLLLLVNFSIVKRYCFSDTF